MESYHIFHRLSQPYSNNPSRGEDHEDVSDELSRFIARVSINRVRVALNRDAREE